MCRHIRVDGVRFEQSPYWCLFAAQCRHLTIENTKVVNSSLGTSFVQGTDQYHFYNCEDVTVDRIFAMGSDDMVVINAVGPLPSRRFDVSNVTCYSLAGARIHTQEGGISDIRFRQFDVLSSILPLNIDLCDAGRLSDVHFEDFYVERIGRYGRPLPFLWIGWEDCATDPAIIENVTAVNIRMPDMRNVHPNILRPRVGGNAACGQIVRNVTFQGLFFGDRPILKPEDGEFDMRNVENVQFLPLE
jgi:hypothetical protein